MITDKMPDCEGRLLTRLTQQWAASIAVGIAALLTQLVLARFLGAEGFAVFGLATSIGMIVLVVQNGGYRQLFMRERARLAVTSFYLERLGQEAAFHATVITIITVAAALGIWVFTGSSLAGAAALACFSGLPRIIAMLVSAELLGAGRFSREARWQLSSRLPVFAAIGLSALCGSSVEGVLLAMALSQVAVLVLKPNGAMVPVCTGWSSSVFPTVASLAVLEFITQLYLRQGLFILYIMSEPTDAIGRLMVLERVAEAFTMFLTPLGVIIHNTVRKSGLDKAVLTQSFGFIVVSSIIITIGVLINAAAGPKLFAMVLGEHYQDTSNIAPWYCAAAFFMLPNMLLGQALIALERETAFLNASFAVCIISFAVTVPLSFLWGSTGVAVSKSLTEASLFALLAFAAFGSGKTTKWLTENPRSARDAKN